MGAPSSSGRASRGPLTGPQLLSTGMGGAVRKHEISRGTVILLGCFSPPLPAAVCSLPVYS